MALNKPARRESVLFSNSPLENSTGRQNRTQGGLKSALGAGANRFHNPGVYHDGTQR
jgi:hypothetical protein